MRLDLYLVEKKLVNSRNKAKELIINDLVLVNGKIQNKPSFNINDEEVTLSGNLKYVSRGGLKLEEAINSFNIDFKNKVICDIGSSTGGFTDCALKHDASYVYSIDVGSNQLDESLRNNKSVKVMEQTNFLDVLGFDKVIDYYIMDVSFVSITKIIPHIIELKGKEIITLIKPQFEIGYKGTKTGIIKNKNEHIEILNNILSFIRNLGLNVTNLTYSPIKGKSGNIEYLCYIGEKDRSFDIRALVNKAFSSL